MSVRIRAAAVAVVTGDRPFVLATLAIVAVGVLMLARPLALYLDGRERVALLETKRQALHAEIDRLEEREQLLLRAEHVELLAREQLGLVMPGEVPYVVITPEDERPQVAPAPEPAPATRPWYRRLLDLLGGVVR